VLSKPIESEDVNKYTVIWMFCTVFLVKNFENKNFQKFSGNFRKDWNKFPEEISGLTTIVWTLINYNLA